MRIVEYYSGPERRLGVVKDGFIYDVQLLDASLPARMLDFIVAGRPALDVLRAHTTTPSSKATAGRYDEVRLAAPLSNGPKLLCVAANYRAHIQESGFEPPEQTAAVIPQFFAKFPSTSIIGPHDPIPLNRCSVAPDWELELAVVIGIGGKHIPRNEALAHVFGYTAINDVSERRMNANIPGRLTRANDNFFDWLTGKWFDGFAPLGPAIVTTDEIADPQNLRLTLDLNGERMQDATTSQMISPVAELIAHISSILRLEPGDIIATGTPEGTGMSRGRFLRPGDVIRCSIEGIGEFENPVVDGEAIGSAA
jgi:2-keto-4-pentenoate hydratase/2-oxohepta-3-ene-1,7-dioic acid hydratase in catechol pathway